MAELRVSAPRRLLRWWRGHLPLRSVSRELPGVPGPIHRRDRMIYDHSATSIENYVRAGRSALENLERCLADAGRSFDDVGACLDFGCGHGRVLRHLCRRIDPARITACDVDAEAVRFCARQFGVVPSVASWRPAELMLGEYDLIWCGSVLTHLDLSDGEMLLDRLCSSLRPGGVLVFTVHGQGVLEVLERLYQGAYAGEASGIRAEVAEHGMSFRPYQEHEYGAFPIRYGMAWHAPGFLIGTVERSSGGRVRLLSHLPRGWDNHHDVLAFERAEAPIEA